MKNEQSAFSCSGHKIPRARYGIFREVLYACGGCLDYAYTLPRDDETNVGFHFDEPGAYKKWRNRWSVMTTDVSEIRRDAKWRRCLRRLNLGFIEKMIRVKKIS